MDGERLKANRKFIQAMDAYFDAVELYPAGAGEIHEAQSALDTARDACYRVGRLFIAGRVS